MKMRMINKVVLAVLLMVGMVLSACGPVPASTDHNVVGAKVDASPIEFTGIVEAIDGNEITVDGKVIVVTPEMISTGDIEVGDSVEVEATEDESGALIAESVELHDEDSDDDLDDELDEEDEGDCDDDVVDNNCEDSGDDSDDDDEEDIDCDENDDEGSDNCEDDDDDDEEDE